MPISGRFVVKYTGLLLATGFLTLLGIVGMTIWLGEQAQTYANHAIQARDTRVSAAFAAIALVYFADRLRSDFLRKR